MEELILYIVKSIVSNPDAVSVEEGGMREEAVIYNLKVADEDKGFVIGKHGKVAKALRTQTDRENGSTLILYSIETNRCLSLNDSQIVFDH